MVVDHDTGKLVWAANGRDSDTVRRFFTELGEERCAKIERVSCDGVEWMMNVVEEQCQNATICLDLFHVVQWATNALDEVRREVWNAARKAGFSDYAKALKGARWALWHNPGNLTSRQRTTLAVIEKTNKPLYRAYLLKEQLRLVFHLPFDKAVKALDRWLSWARRCRLQPFVKLARSVTYFRDDIEAALRHRLSHALVESTSTKIRLITRRSFGFHSPAPLIALAMLSLGGLCHPSRAVDSTHGYGSTARKRGGAALLLGLRVLVHTVHDLAAQPLRQAVGAAADDLDEVARRVTQVELDSTIRQRQQLVPMGGPVVRPKLFSPVVDRLEVVHFERDVLKLRRGRVVLEEVDLEVAEAQPDEGSGKPRRRQPLQPERALVEGCRLLEVVGADTHVVEPCRPHLVVPLTEHGAHGGGGTLQVLFAGRAADADGPHDHAVAAQHQRARPGH